MNLVARQLRGSSRGRSQDGTTLIEVLIALTIISLTVVAGLAALATAITGSSEDRSLATLNALVKSYAETVKTEVELQPAALFSDCAASYPITFTLPANDAGYLVGINATNGIKYFDQASSSFVTTCGAGQTNGLQLITMTATSPSGARESLSLLVRNPDYPSATPNPYAGF